MVLPILTLLTTLLLSTSTTAAPTPVPAADRITFIVTNFWAYVPSTTTTTTNTTTPINTNETLVINTNEPSTSVVQFHFSDPRPQYALNVWCQLYAPSIYIDTFTPCIQSSDVTFRVSEEQLVIRRGWKQGGSMYIQGEARQGTYWLEGVNVTRTSSGPIYRRDAVWEFPVTAMW